MCKPLIAALALSLAAPTSAQDLQGTEIIVTGSRIDQEDYADYMPAVGLRRKADFVVQQATIRGDTRDPDQREEEIRAMLLRAIDLAALNGVEMAQGSYIVTRLTAENASDLELANERRPDSERLDFLIKAPLANVTVREAQAQIDAFIDAVPEVGRAQMDKLGEPTLSVVGPDSYREEIIASVASDARKQADVIGEDYAVEILGLNMPVQWARSGPGEVLLYIPYELKVVPKP